MYIIIGESNTGNPFLVRPVGQEGSQNYLFSTKEQVIEKLGSIHAPGGFSVYSVTERRAVQVWELM